MNKVLPVSLILGIILLIMLGVWHQSYIKNVANSMILKITEVEELFFSKNIEECDIKIQYLIKEWEKTEKLLNIMLNHEEINKISESLIEIESKLKNFSTSNNISSNFALLKMYIKDMEKGNEFTIGNIL